MEKIFKSINNKIKNFIQMKKDIEDLLIKIKSIKKIN
jgi:hypothetical protein